MTTPVPAVHGAICAVMADLAKEGIEKGRRNEQQGYKFRGIEDVYNALCGLLAKHRMTMLPHELLDVSRTTRETQKGGVLYVTYITVRWKFTSAVDGSCDYAVSLGEAMDSADKSSNKSMSAAYKYAAVQCFCIPTEGDDDADATTPEPSRPHVQQPPAQQQRNFESGKPAHSAGSRSTTQDSTARRGTSAADTKTQIDSASNRGTNTAGPDARHMRYWPLFKNSSQVNKPLAEVPTEKLVEYIARLENALKNDKYKTDAAPYYQAALAEYDKRDHPEEPKSASAAS